MGGGGLRSEVSGQWSVVRGRGSLVPGARRDNESCVRVRWKWVKRNCKFRLAAWKFEKRNYKFRLAGVSSQRSVVRGQGSLVPGARSDNERGQ
jgi:hypothetical protein